MVRRLTGGRALLHDDEITYSYITPISIIPNGETISASYKYISGILIDFFKTLGVDLDFGGAPKLNNGEIKGSMKFDYCMLISTGADVCYQGRKIIGSAQYRKQGYILQHGSILFNYDKKLLEDLFHEEVSTDSITTVNEILPNLTKEEFVNRKVARGSNCLKETITDAENTFNEFQLSNNDIDDETMLSYALKLKNIF